VTPKRKRMVNVLDVLETIKLPSTTPKKTTETSEALAEVSVAEAPKQKTGVETGPSAPTKVIPSEVEEEKIAKATEKCQSQLWSKKLILPSPKHLPKYTTISCDMLRGKSYRKKKFLKLINMLKN
jgi:hypothetical protein